MNNGDSRITGFKARVSTDEQDYKNQLLALNEWADKEELKEGQAKLYVSVESGSKISEQDEELIRDIKSGKIGRVVVYSLSRLSRSLKNLLEWFELFEKFNVEMISLKEQIDGSTAGGRAMLHILAAMCQWEKDVLSERTKLGLLRAIKSGKKLGRPKGSKDRRRKRRKYGYVMRWKKERLNKASKLMSDLPFSAIQ